MQHLLSLTLLLLLFPRLSFAQYLPLVEEGKFWVYKNYAPWNPDFPEPISGHAITFLDDTLINSKAYKKIYRLNLKGRQDCLPEDRPCWSFDFPYESERKEVIGYIREEVDNKQVFVLPDTSTNHGFCASKEYLLFDFSLGLGDSLNHCVYEAIHAVNTESFVGGKVDSLKTIDVYNKLRPTIFTYGLHLIIGLPYETEIKISEGIGFEQFGLFYRPQSEFVDYCEGEITQCNLILSQAASLTHESLSIYPNPTQGVLRVSLPNTPIKSLKVYSLLGQLLWESPHKDELDIRELENGIYLLQVSTIYGEVMSERITLVK